MLLEGEFADRFDLYRLEVVQGGKIGGSGNGTRGFFERLGVGHVLNGKQSGSNTKFTILE